MLTPQATEFKLQTMNVRKGLEGVVAAETRLSMVDGERGELVIGRGAHGDVALYRFVPELDTVVVLAVRAQREAGYGVEP